MDINSLLSPQDSPATETPPPVPPVAAPSSAKRAMRQIPSRTPSGLSQQTPQTQQHITSSPQRFHHDPLPPHSMPTYMRQPPATHAPLQSPGHAGYTNGGTHSAVHTPTFDKGQLGSAHDSRMTTPYPLHRQASTPGMDTLADLASMQHVQQTARQQNASQRPSISLQNIPRGISGDSNVSMHTEPSPRTPRVFTSRWLDQASLEALGQLEKALIENPFDYYSHVSFITLLHQGFQNLVNSTDGSPHAAHTYDLLPVLREAFQSMDNRYTLGERLWELRINVERVLATNLEERMAVLEMCQKATREEPYSAKLWVQYGDYVAHLVACVWEPVAPERWSDEEKALGTELFTPDLLLDTWQRGAEFVKYDVSDSHLVWDRYLQALVDDLDRRYNPDKVKRVANIFNDRLSLPHATWDQTLGQYSTFNSRFYQDNYEAIMEYAVSHHSRVKEIYAHRHEHEFNLLKAQQSGDQSAEYNAMTRYLKWEKKTIGVSSFPLVNALFERATVRFPVDPSLWEDHVEFLIWQNNRSVSLLDVLERATRHCPWSGSLWSHRILSLEADGRSHEEIEHVKHSATRTGMLEHNDIEELMKVQIAWCGYLRRKAFDDPKSTEDDADIAEIGIRSALELAHEIGTKKYGKEWAGDPKYRLERIHIKFLTQRGNLEEARHIWKTLVKKQQDSYDFWYRYYIWEMVIWSRSAVRDQTNAGAQLLPPSRATEVLELGLKRLTTVDHPEPLIEMYVNHCEQHEGVLKVRSANIERRRAETIVSIRRAREKSQAEAETGYSAHVGDGAGKRKRQDATEAEPAVKKSKPTEAEESAAVSTSIEPPAAATNEGPSEQPIPKRDREHASIIVRNLPADVTQTRIRKFFTEAGKVRNITMKPEPDQTVTATVEFETAEEAEYALTKETKGFEGRDITIKKGESTTVYVTNYPAHADEAYLRKLFEPCGEILEMRFPSLKFAAHRRFCYVQFASADEAQAATKLDGTTVENLKLEVKISDPAAKKKRSGANEEGRELYVGRLPFSLNASELREAFEPFGTIQNINMQVHTAGKFKGKNKGYAFVVFDTKENAEKAVAAMNGKDMQGFKIQVEIASRDGKPKVKSAIVNNSEEPPDSHSGDKMEQDDDKKTPTPAPEAKVAPVADRTIALLKIPDTVTDARIQKLVEPCGYKKITHLPQHGGAIIEFHDVSAVGKASLALDGHEIEAGRKIRVGTVAELKKDKAEYRAPSNLMKPATLTKRPTAPSARGRGGGLLRSRGKPGLGAAQRGTATAGSAGSGSHGGEEREVKSNEDFRNMLLRPAGSKDKAGGDEEMRDDHAG
ncbi:uncharacterized protein EI97DRAFT_400210 [Westerdykella ornata]|uniref:U4/U6 snRNA-associated-splicing factor PRP24 n=1 Tax=Westerdykella ornata TaxID=318751 RepID=A0A6A6JGX0_WESOR|nr:uncharacterized protein EI97DRAFT_400210 [Westerdykella ornata]KAF2275353.1 hypothetical protein EI97DRAFT_400210 [Westerdykella ornata]